MKYVVYGNTNGAWNYYTGKMWCSDKRHAKVFSSLQDAMKTMGSALLNMQLEFIEVAA